MSNLPIAAEVLGSYVARIEAMNEQKDAINDDLSDLYKEVKHNGFDTKIVKEIVQLRKKDKAARDEHDTILDLYKQALGMLD